LATLLAYDVLEKRIADTVGVVVVVKVTFSGGNVRFSR